MAILRTSSVRRKAWMRKFFPPLAALSLVSLASCGKPETPAVKPETKAEVVQQLSPEENVAASSRGARAIATNNQVNFPVSNLNDGTPQAWGAAEGMNDIYAAVVLPSPQAIQEFRISLFSPAQPPRAHLRDLRVINADSEASEPNWRVVRSRLSKDQPFSEKVTIPPSADGTVVLIEIDHSDPNWGSHKIWGFGCFTASKGDARNYLTAGRGIYVRELQMK